MSLLGVKGINPLAFLDKNEVRERIDLSAVCAEMGIELEGNRGICPFHEDHRPSFGLYEGQDGRERWGCFACGTSGDAFALIQEVEGCSFGQAVDRAREVLERQPERAVGSFKPSRRAFDGVTANATVVAADARLHSSTNLGWLCVVLGLKEEADPAMQRIVADHWLNVEWRVGVGPCGEMVFPHFDPAGTLRAVKYRGLDASRWTEPGSNLSSLYGAWRPRRHRQVLICEGETDALWASWAAQELPVDVLALPAGAGQVLQAWSGLDAATCFLAFDGDDAGDAATAAMAGVLTGRDVRRVQVPRGEDLRSWRPDVYTALMAAERIGC